MTKRNGKNQISFLSLCLLHFFFSYVFSFLFAIPKRFYRGYYDTGLNHGSCGLGFRLSFPTQEVRLYRKLRQCCRIDLNKREREKQTSSSTLFLCRLYMSTGAILKLQSCCIINIPSYIHPGAVNSMIDLLVSNNKLFLSTRRLAGLYTR